MTYWEPTCKDDLPLKNNPAIKLGFWEWSLNESQKDLGTIFCSVCCETEIFYTLKEAKTLIEKWRMEYNTFRPHSSLNYRPPAPEAYLN